MYRYLRTKIDESYRSPRSHRVVNTSQFITAGDALDGIDDISLAASLSSAPNALL